MAIVPPLSSIPTAIGRCALWMIRILMLSKNRAAARPAVGNSALLARIRAALFGAAERVRLLLSRLVVALLAHGHFAPRQADLGKDGGVEAKRLVHVRHDLDDFADEIAILVRDDFGDETRADRLTI